MIEEKFKRQKKDLSCQIISTKNNKINESHCLLKLSEIDNFLDSFYFYYCHISLTSF